MTITLSAGAAQKQVIRGERNTGADSQATI
jgi:hypothetical protein